MVCKNDLNKSDVNYDSVYSSQDLCGVLAGHRRELGVVAEADSHLGDLSFHPPLGLSVGVSTKWWSCFGVFVDPHILSSC